MDAAPTTFAELPLDPRLGVPVPFACSSPRELDKRRVTQCALSRVCGVCGAGLGRPIAFLGSPREEGRNAFHFPPTHEACAAALLTAYDGVGEPVLGQDEALDDWVVVTTASFEFVRPGREDLDRRPTFQLTAVLSG
jgi:hypothetical protein